MGAGGVAHRRNGGGVGRASSISLVRSLLRGTFDDSGVAAARIGWLYKVLMFLVAVLTFTGFTRISISILKMCKEGSWQIASFTLPPKIDRIPEHARSQATFLQNFSCAMAPTWSTLFLAPRRMQIFTLTAREA